MVEKRDPPFKLEMNFGEALERLVQTDPSEIVANDTGANASRSKAGRKAAPFIFELLPAEIEQITVTDVVGSGGLQSLQRRLKGQLEKGNKVALDDAELGQLIRYMTRYDRDGGFEVRLWRAFIRSIYELFARKFDAE